MLEFDLTNGENAKISVLIDLCADDLMKGGVYCFYIDEDIPLYIGQTFNFLSRLSQHLFELKRNVSYFGLEKLNNKHIIKFKILDKTVPYEYLDNVDNEKQQEKTNKIKRKHLEIKFIDNLYPILQNPRDYKFCQKKNKDAIIKDVDNRNLIVKKIVEIDK